MILGSLSPLLAQAASGNQANAQVKLVLMMALMFVMMWFLIIAPQRKRTKEQETMLKALRVGDKVVTGSGIVGIVLSLKDKTVSLRSSDSKLEVLKSAVTEVVEPGSGDSSASN